MFAAEKQTIQPNLTKQKNYIITINLCYYITIKLYYHYKNISSKRFSCTLVLYSPKKQGNMISEEEKISFVIWFLIS